MSLFLVLPGILLDTSPETLVKVRHTRGVEVKGYLECLLDLQVLRTQSQGITRKRDSLVSKYNLRPGFPVSHYRKVACYENWQEFQLDHRFCGRHYHQLRENGRKLVEELVLLRGEGD